MFKDCTTCRHKIEDLTQPCCKVIPEFRFAHIVVDLQHGIAKSVVLSNKVDELVQCPKYECRED